MYPTNITTIFTHQFSSLMRKAKRHNFGYVYKKLAKRGNEAIYVKTNYSWMHMHISCSSGVCMVLDIFEEKRNHS